MKLLLVALLACVAVSGCATPTRPPNVGEVITTPDPGDTRCQGTRKPGTNSICDFITPTRDPMPWEFN